MKKTQFLSFKSGLLIVAVPTRVFLYLFLLFLPKTGKRYLTGLLIMLLATTEVFSQFEPWIEPMTWTGATSNDWHTASNWSGGKVPRQINPVTIPVTANNPVISRAASSGNITILSGAVLTVANYVYYSVHSAYTEITMLNQGTVINNGDLNINDQSNEIMKTSETGIKNDGVFNNNELGIVRTSGSKVGLWNASGTLTNKGELKIIGHTKGINNTGTFENAGGQISAHIAPIGNETRYAIENAGGTFTNTGRITIGAGYSGGTYGLKNSATFNNNTGGRLNIGNPSYAGLWNEGTFTNIATVEFGYPGGSYPVGILNYSTFNHNAGNIYIYRAQSRAIINTVSSTFNNASFMAIGESELFGLVEQGIENYGKFNNSNSGEVRVNYFTSHGIGNHAGTFSNSGILVCGNIASGGTRGIYNEADFNNNTGATIKLDRLSVYGIENVNIGKFTNEAAIHIGASSNAGTHGLRNAADFNNNAGGDISIDRVTESGILNDEGTFTNSADITIGEATVSAMLHGIQNEAVFNNLDGHISIDRAANSGIFTSAGIFTNKGSVKTGELSEMPALLDAEAGFFTNGVNGILKGTGTINAVFFTNEQGILSPGYSPGIQTFTSDEDFSNSTITLEVSGPGGVAGTHFDQIVIEGGATLNNSSTILQLDFGYPIVNGTTFDFIVATSISGTIAEENISFTNTGTGNVIGVTVSYIAGKQLRVTVTTPLPLPVNLVYFNAKSEGSSRQLLWETAMENDNDYFEIQRSTDAKNFQAIGQVKGLANGMTTNRYRYSDSEINLSGNTAYYRLKMVDLDGSFTYSPIERAEIIQYFETIIFPNPVSNSFNIETSDWKNTKAVRMYNVNGTIVYDSAAGGITKSINVGSMANGTYLVELVLENGQTKNSKIVVAK